MASTKLANKAILGQLETRNPNLIKKENKSSSLGIFLLLKSLYGYQLSLCTLEVTVFSEVKGGIVHETAFRC